MIKDIRSKFPDWVNDNNVGKYTICMSDDLDSLLGSKVLEQIKGYKTNYFYSFDELYVDDENNDKVAIGVDIALMKGKIWDNHVTMLSRRDSINPQSANLNAILKISRDNYTDKYAGSTLLQIWSYYNLPLPTTDEGKMILLVIDSSYKGHYIRSFKETQNKYLRMLEFDELIELQDKYTQRDFQKITKKYNLNGKIELIDGKLETAIKLEEVGKILGIDLTLPKGQFKLKRKFKSNKSNLTKGSKTKKNNIFSLALTGQNFVCYSTKQGDDCK